MPARKRKPMIMEANKPKKSAASQARRQFLLDSARMLFSIRLEQRRMIAMQQAALEELHTLVPNR